MKKIFGLFMLIIFLITGCGNSNKVDKLVIGIDDEFAPMSFHNEQNELVGFEVDLAREAAKRLGAEIEFKPISWQHKREEITSGSVDLIWNGLDITDKRKEYMIFSKPYMEDRQILLVREDSDLDIHSEGDLAGKIVGTQAGSTSDDYINQNAELKGKLKDYKAYEKFNEVADALKAGEIEVIVCDEIIARYEMNQNPNNFKIVNVRIGNIADTGIGFRKDNAALRDEIQKVLDEMVADGTAQKISEEWFQADLIKTW